MSKSVWRFGPFTLHLSTGWGCLTFSLSEPHSNVWPHGVTWGWGWGPFVQRLGLESRATYGVLAGPLPLVWRTSFTLFPFGFFRRIKTWEHAPACYRTDPTPREQTRRGCDQCPMRVPCADWWTGGPFGESVVANKASAG